MALHDEFAEDPEEYAALSKAQTDAISPPSTTRLPKSSPERKRLPAPPSPSADVNQAQPCSGLAAQAPKEGEPEQKPASRAARLRWALLIKRVFKTDIERCLGRA